MTRPNNPANYECPKGDGALHNWKRNADDTATCKNCTLTLSVEDAADLFGAYRVGAGFVDPACSVNVFIIPRTPPDPEVCRIVAYQFCPAELPGFVTDDTDNTFTLFSQNKTGAVWYTVTDRPPNTINLGTKAYTVN